MEKVLPVALAVVELALGEILGIRPRVALVLGR
jgi:hypothetical protein